MIGLDCVDWPEKKKYCTVIKKYVAAVTTDTHTQLANLLLFLQRVAAAGSCIHLWVIFMDIRRAAKVTRQSKYHTGLSEYALPKPSPVSVEEKKQNERNGAGTE